ncbi:MAG: CRISPR-associated helicase Cas3' [Bacteroidales bacterium]|nr:CRISPR-associated helicase Cas3' [Bacteroidales bacterium]
MILAHRNLSVTPHEHLLTAHSEMVARLCVGFAAEIGSEYAGVGYLLGLLHDFGKLQPDFQRYLNAVTSEPPTPAAKVPHAALGAYYAGNLTNLSEGARRLCRYIIAGHHRGLYNYADLQNALLPRNVHKIRNCKPSSGFEEKVSEVVSTLCQPIKLSALHTRMLFSALVDADFLDTESFMNGSRSENRQGYALTADMTSLEDRLNSFTQTFSKEGEVNGARARFLSQAIHSGEEAEEGVIYTLNLPTGAGKTVTSMAWALKCARRLQHRRIIYVIPYTSIITQTASVFRKIFGDDAVLEHHSDVNIEEDNEEAYTRVKLLSENWDIPIVVTTNVQFFESLFSHKVSKCRKLHNICNSVVVFDEVQMFPIEYLNPILRTIDQLGRDFKCSILLSSATQPPFDQGLKQKFSLQEGIYALTAPTREVVPYDKEDFGHFDGRVEWSARKEELSLEILAGRLSKCTQVLCVVNSRRDAALVYEETKKRAVGGTSVIHLSRMMCSAHLADRLDEIRRHLSVGDRLVVISTQLIEAGVDLDFPVVYRAYAGIDSIVQAGGRCNREGKRDKKGQLFVFSLNDAGRVSNGIKKAQYATDDTLRDQEESSDMPSREMITAYYEKYYNQYGNGDEKGVCKLLWNRDEEWDFEDASRAFRLIDDSGSVDVYVPYGEEGKRLTNEVLKTQRLDRIGRRRLQRYRVGLREKDFKKLADGGMIERVELWADPNQALYVLRDPTAYTEEVGIKSSNHWQTDTLIV